MARKMSWRVGFPGEFRHLDDEHEEIVSMLESMRANVKSGHDREARASGMRILSKFRDHAKSQDKVMHDRGFPERELHNAYHRHVITTLDTILRLFDHGRMGQHGLDVVRHIENRLSEEIFVDRLLADFLAAR